MVTYIFRLDISDFNEIGTIFRNNRNIKGSKIHLRILRE